MANTQELVIRGSPVPAAIESPNSLLRDASGSGSLLKQHRGLGMVRSTDATVAFVTTAWERDWEVVLWPQRYRMIVQSHQHEFPVRLVVLNNFASDRTLAKAVQAAQRLVTLGLATHYLHAPAYLDEQVLQTFGMSAAFLRKNNPYYSTNHLAALHWLRGKTRYLLNMAGDIWLERAGDWLSRALVALKNHPQLRGLNLCRNIYRDYYPAICHEEHDDFWLSRPTPGLVTEGRIGFGLSDIAYLIEVSPEPYWRFDASLTELEKWCPNWPQYARPCFEMFYRVAMARDNFCHGALRPKDNRPITKHKNVPANQPLKIALYKRLGLYSPGGKYATRFR